MALDAAQQDTPPSPVSPFSPRDAATPDATPTPDVHPDAPPLALPPPFPHVRPAVLDGAAERDPTEVCHLYCTYVRDCFAPICPDGGYDETYVEPCTAGCVDAKYAPEGLIRTMAELDCTRFAYNICGGYPDFATSCACPTPPPIEANTLGAPCTDASTCVAGALPTTCFTARPGQTWPGGYCTANLCGVDADCGPGNACVWREDTSLCYAGCDPRDGRQGCRTRYTCWPDRGPDRGVCAPDCDHVPCPPGARCDGPTGLCFPM